MAGQFIAGWHWPYLINCHQFHLFRRGLEFTKRCELPSQSLGPQGAAARLDANLWWLHRQRRSPKCAWNGVRRTAREAGPHASERLHPPPPTQPCQVYKIPKAWIISTRKQQVQTLSFDDASTDRFKVPLFTFYCVLERSSIYIWSNPPQNLFVSV